MKRHRHPRGRGSDRRRPPWTPPRPGEASEHTDAGEPPTWYGRYGGPGSSGAAGPDPRSDRAACPGARREHLEHLEHLERWASHHHHRHHVLHHGHRVARRVRRPLRRRLFVWFGMWILFGGLVSAVLGGPAAPSLGWPWSSPTRLLAALVILWAASGFIARRLARPFGDIAHVAREIGGGNLAARMNLSCDSADEVGVLAEAINDMASRIERQLADQRVLLAAVSHELRTPLGHLRVLLELIRENGADAKALADMEREIVEIDTLVGELLASSRLDFSALSLRPLDAGELGRAALERAGLDPGLLELPAGADVGLSADATLVGRALANLLENARRHGGGAVALRISVAPDAITFEVDDAGSGIAADAAEKVFEPFYRGDDRGNLGLGLALVKRIAEAHGGRAHAGPRPGGGARVGFVLPRATPGPSAHEAH